MHALFFRLHDLFMFYICLVGKILQVHNPLQNYSRGSSDPHPCVCCTECQSSEDEHLLLLYDLCDSAAHTYGVGRGVTVPEGNWYCHDCTISRNEHTKRQLCTSM